MINLIDDLGVDKALEGIWNIYYNDEQAISPIFSKELYENSITYLSLNPSLQPKDREIVKRGNYPACPYQLVDWKRESAEYKFFNKYYNLGDEVKPWTCLDLLFERESDQEALELKYKKKRIKPTDKIFVLDQIRLTFRILKALKPKIVVVTNAFALKLINENINELQLQQDIPSEENNYIYRIDGIPFITNESKFLGSRFLENNDERKGNLISEIKRIENIIKTK